jgi:outer membrane protein
MRTRSPLMVALLLLAPLSASGQSWPWQARLRLGSMQTHDRSSALPGYDASLDVDGGTSVELAVSYAFRPTWAVELSTQRAGIDFDVASPTAARFRAGGAKLGVTSLILQYRCFALGAIRPYFGAGANRAEVSGFDPSESLVSGGVGDISFDDSISLALQAGVDYDVTDRISVNLDARYSDVATDATLMLVTGDAWQTVRLDIDPWVIAVGVAFRF